MPLRSVREGFAEQLEVIGRAELAGAPSIETGFVAASSR